MLGTGVSGFGKSLHLGGVGRHCDAWLHIWMIVGGLLGGLGRRLTGRGTSSNRCSSEGEAVVSCLCGIG